MMCVEGGADSQGMSAPASLCWSRGPRIRAALAAMLLAMSLSALGVSCGNADNGTEGGQVRLGLTLPHGVTIGSLTWRVLSSTGAVLASGFTDTSNPSATPSLSVSVPPGSGEHVDLTATTSDGGTCTGTSAAFNVADGQLVTISLSITCDPPPPGPTTGTIIITGIIVTGDSCPVIKTWAISPRQTATVGGTIDVTASVTDADTGDTLTYAWAATSGTFADPASATTTYSCASAGTQTLSLSVSDNHQPIPCTVDVSFPPIDCL